MPSILAQGYGPLFGHMRETGGLLGGSSPAQLPGRPPIPQAQVRAPNYQGLAQQYASQDQAASAANTQAAVGGATSAAYLGYLAFLAFCWVAREVFGDDDPRWRVFRHWMLFISPLWFMRLYEKYGRQVAAFLHRHPYLKPPVRWWMQRRVDATIKSMFRRPRWQRTYH